LTPAFSPFFAALAQRLNQERIHAFTKPDTGMLILAPPLVTTSAELEEGLARIADCVSFAAKSLA
jgi:acetylornithine/succinyldiaminopimelate/putrescine aminotransferase